MQSKVRLYAEMFIDGSVGYTYISTYVTFGTARLNFAILDGIKKDEILTIFNSNVLTLSCLPFCNHLMTIYFYISKHHLMG